MLKFEEGEEKMSKKFMLYLAIVALVALLVPVNVAKAATPLNEIVVNTIIGGGPATLDPANCYDTASAELLFNVYEPLIFFDGERYDYFIPKLATQVWIAPPDPAAPIYTNFTVYFKIREGVKFHTWCRSDLGPLTWAEYTLTTEDVEHSFERWMVIDYVGGPQWMIYEPLLSCYGADPEWPADETNPINQAVQRNATHVWLNIANEGRTPRTGITPFTPVPLFEENPASPWYGRQRPQFWSDAANLPLGYPLRIFFQVISQSWASIMSKQWLITYVGPQAQQAVPDHPGEWDGDWTKWLNYWQPSVGQDPAVDIIPKVAEPGVTCGTGPYILDWLQWGYGYSLVRNPDYWGGWPATNPHPPYPDSPIPPSCIRPKGYIERMTVIQVATSTGITNLINGDTDFAAVPRARVKELHEGNNKDGPTLPGIRLNYPIPALVINTFHMTFDIEPTPTNDYGIIYGHDELHEDGIPRNFFSNINVRKAFAHLINYTMIIQDLLLGEAYQPNTFAPSGLPYVNPAIPKYYYDEEKAAYYFDQAYFGGKKLTDYGFTIYITYNSGNVIRQAIAEQLATAINTLAGKKGWPFHGLTAGPAWAKYLEDMEGHRLPAFMIGWLADYADIHNFAHPYCHSTGAFAHPQRYHNPHVDELVEKGLYTPDGPLRQAIYYEIEQIFYDEVPTVPLFVAIGRGYMRDWIQGRYYNPLHPGLFAYDIWKWPMTETVGAEGYFVGDVNFDGKVSMDDIIAIVNAFGSYAGKGGMPVFHPRWNFYCDVDDSPRYRWRDRKIDMGDIVNAIARFGKTSKPWHP